MNPRTWRILAALAIGLTLGGLLADSATGARVAPVIAPIGQLWLNALTMTVVPLVFSLLVVGMGTAAQAVSGGALAARTMLWFAILLVGATLLVALFVPPLLDMVPAPAAAAALRPDGVVPATPGDAASWLLGIIPTNPIAAAAEGAMVSLVLFAILFGIALGRIDAELRSVLERVFRGIVEVMLVIVDWILWLAPIGVAALAFGVGLRLGAGAAGVLIHYVLIVIAACLAVTLLSMLAAVLAGRIGPFAFQRAAFPSQIIAVSTQSSLATLPAMVEAAGPLGVSRERAGVVLPLAVALFKAASAGANVAVAAYLAHLYGIELAPLTLLVGAAVAAAVSVGAVGLPAQVNFFAVIAPVCVAMGVPIELLPLLLAIESIPDIFRTLGNITADLAVLRIVGRGEAGEQHASPSGV